MSNMPKAARDAAIKGAAERVRGWRGTTRWPAEHDYPPAKNSDLSAPWHKWFADMSIIEKYDPPERGWLNRMRRADFYTDYQEAE